MEARDGRHAAPRPGRSAARPVAGSGVSGVYGFLGLVFVVSLCIPVIFGIGSIRLSPYRLLLLLALVPLVLRWLSGGTGPVRAFDLMILAAFTLAATSYLVLHGVGIAYQPAAILLIEAAGAYLLGRAAIRSAADMVRLTRLLLRLLLVLFLPTLYEALTGQAIILDVLGRVMSVFPDVWQDRRLGLDRAQVVFEHSILFGAFVSSMFGFMLYVPAFRAGAGRLVATWLTGVIAFLSISAGALFALVFQLGMRLWDVLTRGIPRRWTLLGLGFLALYILIDIGSNRTPFHVVISYMTFSSSSGYNRILIWQFGLENVFANPLLGLGFNDWERPHWMGDSVDNFWLLHAMRHGVPSFLLFAGGLFVLIRRVSLATLAGPAAACRAGWLAGFGSLILAGITVHYWNALFVWFMFLAGAGAWLLDAPAGTAADGPAEAPRRRTVLSDLPARPGPVLQAAGPRRTAILPATAPRHSKGAPER